MAHKKKLQVFVSSTYTDLKEERQAAVEAILTAGHIPAGMELFTAGDESQMSVIKRWIDESDVYLLILGGRYGSIEPTTGKSYIHLEYEYAYERNKPFFAVVIDDDYLEEKVKKSGTRVIETDNSQKLKDFKAQVLCKHVKFWRDPRDIKLFIMETMSDFSRREDLVGWIPGNEGVNTGAVAEEMARLAKENAELRKEIAYSAPDRTTYLGLTFYQMYELLSREKVDAERFWPSDFNKLVKIGESFADSEATLLHFFWMITKELTSRPGVRVVSGRWNDLDTKLIGIGLLQRSTGTSDVSWTETGKQFHFRLELERNRAETRRPARNLNQT